jgi:hypothetical protein
MAESKTNLFIPIPGTVTGDLWHLAAAHILSLKYRNDWELVTVVVLTDKGHPDELQHGRATFNYLRDLSLPCMVIKLYGLGQNASKKLTEIATYTLEKDLQQAWQTQKHSTKYFDQEVADLARYSYNVSGFTENSVELLPYKRVIPNEQTKILQLMTATTIAIQILVEDKNEFEKRRKFLKENMVPRLSAKVYSEANRVAEEKWGELKQLIQAQRDYSTSAGVLLYLNRKNQQANTNTNSSEQILTQVKGFAGKRKRIVQVVAVGADPEKDVFDLFNKRTGEKYPGINPCATALLWSKVALAGTHEGANQLGLKIPIDGIFSGRSGAIDLPAFCGVNCFFWDQPWLQAAGDKAAFDMFSGLKMYQGNRDSLIKNMDGQMSQCLRALELYPIMATGLADEIIDLETDHTWGSVRLQEVEDWLDNRKQKGTIFPGPPSGSNWYAVSAPVSPSQTK